jgi:uncharacterized protein
MRWPIIKGASMHYSALRLIFLFLIVTQFFPAFYPSSAFAVQEVAGKAESSDASSKEINGLWVGVLNLNGMKMRFVLKVTRGADGALAVKMGSPDQGIKDMPMDSITCQDGLVRFGAKAFGIFYEGKLNKEGTEISGQLKQGPTSIPLIFKHADSVPTLNRPQDPVRPFPYDEEEVAYENRKDGVRLAGTLTIPRTKGPFPAVLLITGSGSQDRDETIAGHRPFLILADHLTRLGIAVLRVDDRGMGSSSIGNDPFNVTSVNFEEDVMVGIEFLKGRKEIDAGKIGLIGHSEGGMIASMVAAKSKDIAFIVIMAGPGQIGEDLILLQTELLNKARGMSNEVIVQGNLALQRAFAIVKEEKENSAAEKRIKEALAKQVAEMTQEQRDAFAPMQKEINAWIPLYVHPWFRFFISFNPRPVLMKVSCPVLAINGERDLQVSAKENLAGIVEALKDGENKDYKVVSLPNLNHLFQTCRTGTISEYGQIEETISPVALKTISDWILAKLQKG